MPHTLLNDSNKNVFGIYGHISNIYTELYSVYMQYTPFVKSFAVLNLKRTSFYETLHNTFVWTDISMAVLNVY